MKFLFFFLTVCLAAACGSFLSGGQVQKPATKEFLIRQKSLLRLLDHVNVKIFYEDQVRISNNWRFMDHKDKFLVSSTASNVQVLEEFYRFYTGGFLLPRGKIFSISYDEHRRQAIALFHLFFYAKDYETFYNTACWAREHVNEGMFVYSLTVAVLHRRDCMGLVLPSPYEIYPFLFLNNEIIEKAHMLKVQEKIYDIKQGDFYGVHKIDNNFFITSNYSGWYLTQNDETKISYFMEDIGLNSYYFYFHCDYPFWMGSERHGLNQDRRGEIYYYFHQQLLARFYMERLSNGLGEIPRMSWNWPVKTGFMSNLKYHNGMDLPSRPNFLNLKTEENMWDLLEVKDCERRIREAVYLGFVRKEDGSIIDIRKSENINVIGNIIQGNRDSPNTRFYRYLGLIAKGLVGNSVEPHNKFYTVPSVLENYESALRDPMFYQIYQRFVHYAILYKETLPFYTRDELNFVGVKVEDVHVDRLVTFFDFFDININNALYRKQEEVDKKMDNFMFYARQRRLNHEQFNVNIDIMSDKGTDCVVRIFLGPKYDSLGRKLTINDNRVNFFELDSFLHTLKVGRNTIVRNSRDFVVTVKDRTMTNNLMKHIDASLTGNNEFMLDMSEAHNGFPDRLLLPRGKRSGMPFVIFVMVSPYHQTKLPIGTGYDKIVSAGVGTGARFLTKDAMGYPFDRRIVKTEFFTPNMFFKDVMIYHKSMKDLNRVVDTDFMGKEIIGKDIITDSKFMDTGFMDTDKTFMDRSFMDKDLYERKY